MSRTQPASWRAPARAVPERLGSFWSRVGLLVWALVLTPVAAVAESTSTYYSSVDSSTGSALRASLHTLVDDHQRYPYTSTATDTWDILEEAQSDPEAEGFILDLYGDRSLVRQGGGNSEYNREHTWPKSYGFPNDSSQNSAYTDCHMLFLADSGYNSSRSNKPYGMCDAACTEKPTGEAFEGSPLPGVYPGQSNWTKAGVWETWEGRRGDVARALLYADIRYEGGSHSGTGAPEPDLILTDEIALIETTPGNASMAYMGNLTTLLEWHRHDPPDEEERARNDIVQSYQGNRNPFIDHPEWADCVFSEICGAGPVPLPTLSPLFLTVGILAIALTGFAIERRIA
jgi:endonuclease I